VDIRIVLDDITTLKVDAIVNAANHSLLGGGGVDGAIHRAAGPGLLNECKSLNGCATGEAKITQAYRLPSKYVIHTVGPVYSNYNSMEAEDLLAKAYLSSLELANSYQLESIAFPNISTGVYGYPKKSAAQVVSHVIKEFVASQSSIKQLLFCCFDEENYLIYKKLFEKN